MVGGENIQRTISDEVESLIQSVKVEIFDFSTKRKR